MDGADVREVKPSSNSTLQRGAQKHLASEPTAYVEGLHIPFQQQVSFRWQRNIACTPARLKLPELKWRREKKKNKNQTETQPEPALISSTAERCWHIPWHSSSFPRFLHPKHEAPDSLDTLGLSPAVCPWESQGSVPNTELSLSSMRGCNPD